MSESLLRMKAKCSPMFRKLRLESLEARRVLALTTIMPIDLGSLGGGNTEPEAINDSGQVVGSSDDASFTSLAFTYKSSSVGIQSLGTLADGTYSFATGINAAGQVVGFGGASDDSDEDAIQFGTPNTDLAPLIGAGTDSFTSGINASGWIIGDDSPPGSNQDQGYLYEAGPTVIIPGFADSAGSEPEAINASGTVVGSAGTGVAGVENAFLYNQSNTPPLQNLGTLGGTNSAAFGINASGQVVGRADLANGSEAAFLWSGGSMKNIDTLNTGLSAALGINNAGQVVGDFENGGGANRAFFYDGTQMIDLNTLLPANSGWVLQFAVAINNKGQVVGTGLHNGVEAGFLVNVTPTSVWTGGGNGTWSDPADWQNSAVPADGSAVDFPSGVANTTSVNDLPANMKISELDLAGNYQISGNSLTLTGGISATAGTSTLNNPITLSGDQTFSNTGTSTVIIAGQVTGTAALTLSGKFQFTQDNSATYSGNVTLDTATVFVTNSALGTGTLQMAMGTTDSLIPADATNGNTLPNDLQLNNAILDVSTGNLTLSGFVSLSGNSTLSPDTGVTVTVKGSGESIGPAAGSLNPTLSVSGAGIVTLNDNIAPGIFSIRVTSGTIQLGANIVGSAPLTVNGGTLVGLKSNAYAGTITLQSGTITANDDSSLGTGNLIVNAGGNSVSLAGAAQNLAGQSTITLPNTLEMQNVPNGLAIATGNIILSNVQSAVQLDQSGEIDPAAGASLTINGPITGQSSQHQSLTVGGNGTVKLGGAIDPSAGIVSTTSGSSSNETPTLQLLGGLSGTGTLRVNGGTLSSFAPNTFSGTIDLDAGSLGIGTTSPNPLGTATLVLESGTNTIDLNASVIASLPNTFDLNGGTLALHDSATGATGAELSLAGSLVLQDQTTSTIQPATSLALGGAISGSGTLQITPPAIGAANGVNLDGSLSSASQMVVAAQTQVNVDGTFSGSGTFIVDGKFLSFAGNSFAGAIQLQSGTLSVSEASAPPTSFGTAAITVQGSGNFLLPPATFANSLEMKSGAVLISFNSSTSTGNIKVDGASELDFNEDGDVLTSQGQISGPGVLSVGGADGTLALGGTLNSNGTIFAIANANVQELPGFVNKGTISAKDGGTVEYPGGSGAHAVGFTPPSGATLANMTQPANPSPADTPNNVTFPVGFFDYELTGLTAGAATTVTINLPAGTTANAYMMYGGTPDKATPHWYDFIYDPTTGTGAQFTNGGSTIVLNFVDGLRGDGDLAANGTIVDPGAPAAAITPASSVAKSVQRTSLSNIPVTWSGADSGGPGIASYTIYDSEDGGPYSALVTNTTQTSGTFTGAQIGHSYAFYAEATDTNGIVEPAHVTADTTITTAAFPWQNPNGNHLDVIGKGGVITPFDALLVIDYLNANTPGTQLPASQPVNGNYLDVLGKNVVYPLDVLTIFDYLNAQAAMSVASASVTVSAANSDSGSRVAAQASSPVVVSPAGLDAALIGAPPANSDAEAADPARMAASQSAVSVGRGSFSHATSSAPTPSTFDSGSAANAIRVTSPAKSSPSSLKTLAAPLNQSRLATARAGSVDALLSDLASNWLDDY